MKNCLDNYGGKKRPVHTFRRKEFWKYINYIILAVTYRKKGHNIWGLSPKYFSKNPPTKLHIYVHGNTYLNKLCCDIYCPH